MKIKISCIFSVAILYACFGGIRGVYAYSLFNCGGAISWNSPPTFTVPVSDFPNGQYNAVKSAAESYQSILGANADINIQQISSSSNLYYGDGTNSAYRNYFTGSNSAKVKHFFLTNCDNVSNSSFLETDIWFNPSKTFTTSYLAYENVLSNTRPIHTIALHEFGHVLGFSGGSNAQNPPHELSIHTLMNNGYNSGGYLGGNARSGPLGFLGITYSPHADEAAGIRFLYPSGSSGYDVTEVVLENQVQTPI